MTVRIEPGSTDFKKPCLLYDNVFLRGTVTISSDTDTNAGENAFEDSTFDVWLAVDADANIAVDLGAAEWCDTVAIDAHELGSDGATLLVQSSDNGSAWTTRFTLAPADDTAILGLFSLTKARYWRVRVTSGPSPIGIIRLGRRLVIPTGVLSGHIGIAHSRKYELMAGKTLGGHFLPTRINRLTATTTINFGLMDAAFVDTDLRAFETHYNEGLAFFFAASPLNYPDDIGFCRRPERGGELQTSYQEGGELMPVQMDVEVYVNA